MSAVDIFTAPRMKQIEDTTVVGGLVDANGNLLLSTRAGEAINAGNVVGPEGPGFTYRGAWTASTPYEERDVLTSNGSTFVVTTEHISSTTEPTADAPGVNLSLWSTKGQDGTDGTDGTDGLDGMPGDSTIPAGTISLWVGDVAPANWMICDGSAVSRAQYPSLFETIGIKYGAGDGVNTFNLPNLKGKTPIGRDSSQTEFNTLAKIGGEKAHLLTVNEMPSHSHTMRFILGPGTTFIDLAGTELATADGSNSALARTTGTVINKAGPIDLQGGGAAHNVLQPYVVVNFIIKTSNGDTPGDSQLTQRVSDLEISNSSTPAGTISLWPSDVAPTNWLFCDGAAVSRTTYASLFAAIGIKYGSGDGSTTFNLPNLKGRAPVGKDSAQPEFDTLGEIGGAKTHVLTVTEMPSHTHATKININTVNARTAGSAQYNVDNAGTDVTTATGGGGAHNNLQPYQIVNFIIKFANGDTPSDSALTQRVSALETGTNVALKIRDRTFRMQDVLTGGGRRKVNATTVSWDQRFVLFGTGRDADVPGGYFEIYVPPNGTIIPVIGHSTITQVTVVDGRIPLGDWMTLYYEIPFGAPKGSVPGNFKIVSFEVTQLPIPSNWVLICTRNSDDGSAAYTWGDGRSQDYWKTLPLLNNWTYYGAPYAWPDWRYADDGRIQLRGLMRSGTAVQFAKFSYQDAPDSAMLFDVLAHDGNARIDINSDGVANVIRYTAGGTASFISLDQISWFPKF